MIQEGLYCRFCFCFADREETKKSGGSAEIQLVNKPFKKFARLSNYLDPHQKTAHHKKLLEKAQAFLEYVRNPNRNIDRATGSRSCKRNGEKREDSGSVKVERHDDVLTFIQLKHSIEATLEDISSWPGESCASDCCDQTAASMMRSKFLIALMSMKHLLERLKLPALLFRDLR